jgi:predicted amino acid racemase
MKLQSQVCTLEQAKKLNELGVKQDSLFYWIDRKDKSRVVYSGLIEDIEKLTTYSAFTVAELGVMLPCYYVVYYTVAHGYCVCRKMENGELQRPLLTGCTQAKAGAAMLIFLLENNLTTAEEVNQRLAIN